MHYSSPKEKKQKRRKRKKSKTSPLTDKTESKKVKQATEEASVDSESDNFFEAEDNFPDTSNPSNKHVSEDEDAINLTQPPIHSDQSETEADTSCGTVRFHTEEHIMEQSMNDSMSLLGNEGSGMVDSGPILQPSESQIPPIAHQMPSMVQPGTPVQFQSGFTVPMYQPVSTLHYLEQYSRRACLRISGIKEEERENTDQLVLDLANKLKIDLNPNDIDRSHRAGPARTHGDSDSDRQGARPREIIVKLKSYQVRLALLKGRKTLRNNREAIFINEDLTQKRKGLAYECIQLKRERKILSTWVYDGNVFVTDRSGLKVKVIQDDELEAYRTLVVPPASQDRLVRH